MRRNEYEAKKIIADVIVLRDFKIRHSRLLLRLELATQFFMFAFEKFVPAKVIDRAMLRGGHEPGAWVIRDARLWPLFECGD